MGMGSTEVTPLERQQLRVAQQATFWHRVRFAIVLRVVRRVGAGAVVDLGAGSGMLGAWLHSVDRAIHYRFAESSPTLAVNLRERFGAENETVIGGALPERCVVAMLDVIEHIDDDVAALRAVAAVMDSGSHLVLTVPAMPVLFSQWDTALGHHRRYSRRSLRRSLEAAGMRVESITFLFPELLPIAVYRRIRPSEGSSADFPSLPTSIDRFAGAVSSASALARRVWPMGTSLVAVATAEVSR